MKLLVVILNYRTAHLCVDCLASLVGQAQHVVVVDGASGDDSVSRIGSAIEQRGWASWAKLMPLTHNGGFAAGNNAAIRPALASDDPPDYVLLLNPDTVVRPGAIDALVHFMDAHPQAGIAGSRLEHPDATPQRSAFRFHTVLSELEHGLRLGPVSKALSKHIVAPEVSDDTCRTDWVAGASMIIRRKVLEDIGLLDESYFMYFEETDFCLRAARAGWETWYVPSSRVVHLVGQASGVTDSSRARKRRPKYWFDSRRRYFRKNHGLVKALAADVMWSLGFGLFRIRQVIQRKPDTEPRLLLWDFVRYNFLSLGK